MANVGKMHPDLMGAPGFELARQQRRHRFAVTAVEALQDFPVGYGVAPALPHGHFFARMRMAVDRGVHRATVTRWHAPDKGHVAASHGPGAAMIRKLRAQRLM